MPIFHIQIQDIQEDLKLLLIANLKEWVLDELK